VCPQEGCGLCTLAGAAYGNVVVWLGSSNRPLRTLLHTDTQTQSGSLASEKAGAAVWLGVSSHVPGAGRGNLL
jgi:hypothetical protein